jgi:hypothetical protein
VCYSVYCIYHYNFKDTKYKTYKQLRLWKHHFSNLVMKLTSDRFNRDMFGLWTEGAGENNPRVTEGLGKLGPRSFVYILKAVNWVPGEKKEILGKLGPGEKK